MCTLTYSKSAGQIVLTSNRDEHQTRPQSLDPAMEHCDNASLLFSRDPQGGGTWFSVASTGQICILLNGALHRHAPVPPYRRSRGLVLLDIAKASDTREAWSQMDLEQIEPFTLVVASPTSLVQMRWDGKDKSYESLNPETTHIWSSSTLYNPEWKQERQTWFEALLQRKEQITANDLLHFHRHERHHNLDYGLVIRRANGMMTKSISQAIVGSNGIHYRYIDLVHDREKYHCLRST